MTKESLIYYSSGNDEALARPRRPPGVENKTAWFVGVPEVFNSAYDIRMPLTGSGRLRDSKGLDVQGPAFVRNLLMKELDKTQIGALLREFRLVGSH